MGTKEQVAARIEDREASMVEFLSDLVAARTVTGNEGPGQELLVERFEALGLEPDVWEPDPGRLRDHEGYFETSSFARVGYEGRPNVAARLAGSGDGPTLALSGHVDVVDVTEDEWDHDPWALTREGDRLFGRGAADMKGGLAAILLAVESLRDLDVDLAGDLLLLSTIEEEDGGVGGTLSALERGYVPDAALVAEPYGVPNVGTASAGVMYFRVTVPGKSAHAAWGHEGVNAIGKATEVYRALDDLDRERKARIDYEPAYRATPGLEGNVTNINLGTIRAGDWPSTVPAEAVVEGRVGWPPGESREEVREQVEGAVDAVATDDGWLADNPPRVEWFGWQAAPHEVPEDCEIATRAKRNAEAATGREGQFIGGSAGLDERFYERYYDVHAVSVGPEGERLHGADETTTVTSLLETATTLAWTALDYCGEATDD
ncbi:ArgE/DapE family deacylase [Halomarina litorea]|uniref:ArgE/DapE family deacylase n=1 Tax=Halomarina litorea TaxID=2961595 RepID=UPI0020C1FC69|nr:ArgE/DapE family deacylase [Halomarina sp. BCD28]